MGRIPALLCACWVMAGSAAAQDGGVASVPSLASLFTDLGDDVVHLGNVRSIEVLAAGGGASLAIAPFDRRLTEHAAAPGTAEDLLDSGQIIGHAAVQIGGAFGTFAIGRLTHHRRLAVIGAELVRAQLLNGGVTLGLKYAVRRERPDAGGPYSFPSGHSSAAFATATVLRHELGWKAGLAAYGVAAYVAASRLSEDQHFPSDVIFGAAIGIVSAHAVTLGHGRTRIGVTPYAAAHRRGIEVAIF